MPFLRDFFQNLFGGNNERHEQGFDDQRKYVDRFRNPIWKNDEEEDDDDYGDDERQFDDPHRTFSFHFSTDPSIRHFESEIDNLLKAFGFAFGQHPSIESFDDQNFPQLLPPPEKKEKHLRDEFLKPDDHALVLPNYGKITSKVDNDLDGKVTVDDIADLWKEPNTSQITIQPADPLPRYRFSYSQKSWHTVRHSDGTMEEKRTVTDSQGNTETTIKYQLGDKTRTIVTKRNKDGVETQTESFVNVDPDEARDFRPKFSTIEEPNKIEPGTLTDFPWHKFFGNGSKL